MRIAHNLLYKLRYEYKDIHKNIFIDRHKQSNIIENQIYFLQKIEELKPYKVEFEENGIMKPKIYPANCALGGNNQQPIVVITYDKCTFSANNGIRKTWT